MPLSESILSPQEQKVKENHGQVVWRKGAENSRIARIYNQFKLAPSVVDVQRDR